MSIFVKRIAGFVESVGTCDGDVSVTKFYGVTFEGVRFFGRIGLAGPVLYKTSGFISDSEKKKVESGIIRAAASMAKKAGGLYKFPSGDNGVAAKYYDSLIEV